MSFINDIASHAQKAGKEYNILPSLIIAQAIHESNWGRSGLAQKGKNLFGVKGSYNGQSITMKTWEVYNGKSVYVDAAFRKYPSWYESLLDLCELYQNGLKRESVNRYRHVLGETDYKKAAQAVASAGYATDPRYSQKVINTIEVHDLTKYDSGSAGKETPPAAGSGSSVDEYTVKPGDTLGEIAADFDTTISELMKLNPDIKSRDIIFPGQVIKVEGAAPAKKAPAAAQTYTVKPGDALSKIAAKHNTTVDKLADLNNIRNVDLIRVGQVLKISGSAAAPKKSAPEKKYHTVKSGDSLSVIAAKHNVSLEKVKSLNPGVKGPRYIIHPGQKIRYQ